MMINPIISSNQLSCISLRLTNSSYPTIPKFRLYYIRSHKAWVFCMFDLMCTPFRTTFSVNYIFLIEYLQEFVTCNSTEKWGAISAQTHASAMVNNFFDNSEHTKHNNKFRKLASIHGQYCDASFLVWQYHYYSVTAFLKIKNNFMQREVTWLDLKSQ